MTIPRLAVQVLARDASILVYIPRGWIGLDWGVG